MGRAIKKFARLYGLTGAEWRLLRVLLDGKRLHDYAREARISANTAKAYLRQIFDKTGTRRQAELIRLLLADPLLRLVALSPAEAKLGDNDGQIDASRRETAPSRKPGPG